MKKFFEKKPTGWKKIRREDFYVPESFLRERERMCVTASSRFLRIREENSGTVWRLKGSGGTIGALLLHYRQTLSPIFNGNRDIPAPRFLNRFLGRVHVHAVQGIREDAEILENLMEVLDYRAAECIDYDLMNLDGTPRPEALPHCPAGLVLRPPRAGDGEALFALQSAYEREEVLPKASDYNPAVTRHNLDHILSSERVLVAELDGQIAGKINTSAESFTRYQIGGVYVCPEYRGRGIAAKMTSVFCQNLLAEGRGVTLFVKKRNAAARAVYRKAGFTVSADYRISYY